MPASSIRDPGWLDAQLAATSRWYRLTRRPSVGVLWWYSVSSVLLGPVVRSAVRSAVAGAPVADPGLDAMTLYLHPDGRVLDARSAGTVPSVAPALAASLGEAVTAVAAASGAPEPALWAVATDSLANQVLWSGGNPGAATDLTAAIPELPVPRYVTVAGRPVVRRASCCLVYQAPGQQKCVSCPRQHPDERDRRLRAALDAMP